MNRTLHVLGRLLHGVYGITCVVGGALALSEALAVPPVIPLAAESLTSACRVQGDAGSVAAPATYIPLPDERNSMGTWFAASSELNDGSGYLARYAMPQDGLEAGGTSVRLTPLWEAGRILTGDSDHPPMPLPEARDLYTAQVERDGSLRGIALRWPELSPAQQALLDRPAPSAQVRDGLGARRLEYIRGVRHDEGSPFRRRSSLLGAALRSAPLLVGPPSAASADAAYATFRQRYAQRRALVYLASNDGMLHAFDLADGVERYAYTPNALMPYLPLLTDPAYLHRALLDGPLLAGDVLLAQGWRSVLLAPFGSGVQGLFALDVTQPEALGAGAVLWEFTDAIDPMVGNVLTPAQLARVRGRAGTEMAVAVFASGLNNYGVDGHASSAGKGALFILSLDKPPAQGWQLNNNYFRLITPITDTALANGLSAPALLADREGLLRFAYAGDLQGNLWRFDLHGHAPWTGSAERLFTARDAQGRRQPISQQPAIAYGDDGGYLIVFGTGRLFNRNDLAAPAFATQSLYAVRDHLERPVKPISGRQALTERQLLPNRAGLFDVGGELAEAGSRGWYVDFWQSAQTGERSIDTVRVIDGTLVLTTLLPGAYPCSAARSRSYALNVSTGRPADSSLASIPATSLIGLMLPEYVSRPALVPFSSVVATSHAGAVVKVAREVAQAVLSRAADGAIRASAVARIKLSRRAGRLSWREVSNWRELHEASK